MAPSHLPVTWLVRRRCFALDVAAFFKEHYGEQTFNKVGSLYFGL